MEEESSSCMCFLLYTFPISNFDPWASVYWSLIVFIDGEVRVLWRSRRLGLMGL